MINVFFQGDGLWIREELLGDQVIWHQKAKIYRTCGIFRLTDQDDIFYRHTGRFGDVKILLPCESHPASEFSMTFGLGSLDETIDNYYFAIGQSSDITLAIADPLKMDVDIGNHEPEQLAKLTKSGGISEHQPHTSNQLKILNQASDRFWGNADPAEKDTCPINETVSDWLKRQGLSGVSAGQGAVIIRPKWAPKGRRSKK